MSLNKNMTYVGRMKQPLQTPEIDNPSMLSVHDEDVIENALILLTPGAYTHAYQYLKNFNSQKIYLITPSLQADFISDIYNLYMTLKDIKDIHWVFPDRTDIVVFQDGQIKDSAYINNEDTNVSISFIKNEHIDSVYDLKVSTDDSVHYFSYFLTEDKLQELYDDASISNIHLPMSQTLYGGLSYTDAMNIKKKYGNKLIPYNFASIDEFYEVYNVHSFSSNS